VTIEDWALTFEGMDPVKIQAVMDDTRHLISVIKAEMPRVAKLIDTIQEQISAYEANQRKFQ
jgi:hypothetical protein